MGLALIVDRTVVSPETLQNVLHNNQWLILLKETSSKTTFFFLSCFRFHECPKPKYSKFLRGVAFIYPYMFDNIPLFYRVGSFLTSYLPFMGESPLCWCFYKASDFFFNIKLCNWWSTQNSQIQSFSLKLSLVLELWNTFLQYKIQFFKTCCR